MKQLLFAFHDVIVFGDRLAKIMTMHYLCRKLFIMLKTKDSWDKLSMFEKADLIKYAVQNGIYNPNIVRQAYNEHADGGRMKSNDSVTLLQQPMQTDRILLQWVNNLTEQKRNHDARLFALGGNIGDDDDTVTINGVTYSKEPKKINPGTFDWNYATYLPSGEVLDTKTGNYGPVLLNEVIKTAPFVHKPLSIEDYANKARRDYLTVSNDATIVNPTWNAEFRGKPINPHLKDRAEHGAKSNALWEKEHPVLSTLGTVASAVPFAVASYPLWGTAATAGADALAATKFGQAGIGLANTIKAGAASSPWWPWVEQGINSLFAVDAVDKWSKGQVDAESIVEGLPLLGPVAKSAEMAANAANRGYEAARNWYDLATIANDVNKGIKADRGSTIAGLNNDAAKTLIQAEESWASSLPRARDYSITRVEPYSGYTPTNQSAAYQNFVDDVEQGVSWGRNRGVAANPTRNTDFGNGVPDLKPVGSGAEARVMEDPNDPSRVLKFSTDYGLSARTQAEALKNAEQFAAKRNVAPYNMPLSVEGTYEDYGSFYPVFSQERVTPIGSENAYTVSRKLGELNNSVNGSGWYPGPIRTNSILSENDIARTLDFKPENLGITKDGSLVGIDLGIDYRGQLPSPQYPIKITPENAASVTPEQWRTAYRAAYERGDRSEGQRLWDLWFKQKAPNTKQTTPMFNASGESTFNEFNGGKTGLNWFSESEEYAANHGIPRAFYINEPDIHFGNVPAWVKGTPANEKYIESLKKLGYSEEQIARRVQEINEAANSTAPAAKSIGMGGNNELVTRNNNTMKLAEPFTLADDGSLIDITERANFSKNDIRYSWLPWLLGGGTAATLYGNGQE